MSAKGMGQGGGDKSSPSARLLNVAKEQPLCFVQLLAAMSKDSNNDNTA